MGLRFKIAANTIVQILGKLISSGSTFLITVLLARRFGVTGFGEFVKITTYVSLFYLIVDFGLNAVTLKEVSNLKLKVKSEKLQFKVENYFSNLLGLRIVFALVLIFLALATLVFLPFNPLTLGGFTPLSKLGIIILVPTILTQAIFTSANAVFQKKLRYDLSVIASSVGSLITLALVFLLLKTNSPLLLVVGSYLIGGLVMAGIAFYLSKLLIPKSFALLKTSTIRGGRQVIFNPDTSEVTKVQNFSHYSLKLWRGLFLKSLPLGLTLIFNLIYFKADTLILTVFRPTSEVGIYGLARSFFEFPLAIPTFFMNAIYPVLIQRTKNKEQRTKEQEIELFQIIKKAAIFLIISSLLLSVICYLLSPYLTLIKQDFAPSVLVFRILSLYLPVFFLSSLFMWTLIAFGKQKLLVLIYGNAMIINILLNLFFIPRYGFLAAAVILGASELIVLGLTGGFCLELFKKNNES
ncbi:flippase [Candidatus Microgenomates bacterium]|nr:flippase [Candidatus Microgenomates bacterium]